MNSSFVHAGRPITALRALRPLLGRAILAGSILALSDPAFSQTTKTWVAR